MGLTVAKGRQLLGFVVAAVAAAAAVLYFIASATSSPEPTSAGQQPTAETLPETSGVQHTRGPEQQAMRAASGFVTGLHSMPETDTSPSAWVDRIREHTSAAYLDELTAGLDRDAITPRYVAAVEHGRSIEVRIVSVTGFRPGADEQNMAVTFDEIASGPNREAAVRQQMPVSLSLEDDLWKVSGSAPARKARDA